MLISTVPVQVVYPLLRILPGKLTTRTKGPLLSAKIVIPKVYLSVV